MGGKLNALSLVLVAAATLLHGSAAQTNHTVGDALGWTIPPSGASTYSSWASNKTFNVGDTLVFNFANGQHNVAQVTKTAFDACNTASPISIATTSPASIKLNETGSHYFICTVGTHCSLGQKLAVNVSRASSPSPSPSPSPTPRPSTPPSASPVPAPQPSAPPTGSPVPAPAPEGTPPSPTATPPSPPTPPSSATPPSPASSPNSPTPTTSSTPPPSGATSPTPNTGASPVPGFSAALLSIAAALLF